jgi:hypothetical protein
MKALKLIFIYIYVCQSCYNSYSQTIHLLLATDIDDIEYSQISIKSKDEISLVFDTIAKNMDFNPVEKYYHLRSEFTGASIKNRINLLKIGQNDVIVFYFSGLVFYPKQSKSKFPFLSLSDSDSNPTSLDEIGKLLLEKGARLAFAIADCRNTRLELEIPQNGAIRPTVVSANKKKEIIRNLMNTSCGLIKLASKIPNNNPEIVSPSYIINPIRLKRTPNGNEFAKSPNEHSVFTLTFFEEFENTLKKPNELVKWPDFIRIMQYRINQELNPTKNTNRQQALAIEIIPCQNNSISSNLTWSNLPQTSVVLEAKLNQLIDIQDIETRKIFIEDFKKAFDPNKTTTLTVYRAVNSQQNARPVKKKNEFLSIDNYLNTMKNYNPRIMSINVVENKSNIERITAFSNIILEEFYSE